MNTIIRAGWLTASWLFAVAVLTAQTTVQENLSRADKQFDLYAYNLALRTYEQVIKEQSNNGHALARIGDCYFQLNKPQEALPWYDRAVALGNAAPATMFSYGKALMHTGDYIGAKKWFVLYAERNRDVGMHYAQMCDFALNTASKESLFLVLDEPLNTAAADYSPAFYLDKVVYNSARTDIKRQTTAKTNADWTGSAYNQLYVTQRNRSDNYLQQPTFLRDDLQQNYNEGPVSFSADGRRVAYCRNNFIDGTRQIAEKGVNMSLYIADVVNGNWINDRAFPFNGSDFATGFPCLTADGNTLYFASNQAGGLGGWDIYVSKWAGGTWSVPRNLGSPLNTPGDEITPFFDGTNLYFSSDWHNGLGGQDVFRADINNDFISNIIHMGTGINSSRDDYGFIFDPRSSLGYLTSNRPEGRGNEDIWQVRKTVDEFVITVTDPQRNPIGNADIDFSGCNAGIKQTDASGRYAFAVAAGKADCRVTVRKTGYSSTVVPIQSSGEKKLTAVLLPEYGTTTTTQPAINTPDTYQPETYNYGNTLRPTEYGTSYSTQTGTIEQYRVYVTDAQGRPVSAAELNLNSCTLPTVYTDYAGQGAFYLQQGANCNLVVRKNGYEDVTIPMNMQTSRVIPVTLRAAQQTIYTGSVLDASSRAPLQNVLVSARARQSGHQARTTTDLYGKYTLQLSPFQTYDISYTKDGYLDFASTIQTESSVQGYRTINPVTLIRGQSMVPASSAPITYNTVQPASGGMISLADLEEVAGGYAPQTITTTPPSGGTYTPNSSTVTPVGGSAPVTGYSVQLSANPNGYTDSQIRKYDALSGFGNIYSVKEGSLHKLRLGMYSTRETANDVLRNNVSPVVKDAFVVEETQGTASMLVGPPQASSASIAYKGLAGTPRYAVQVASWPNDNTVLVSDYANLAHLGNTYIQPEDNRLRVRVGTYATYEQAQAIQAQAVQLGYRDAIIVREDPGDLSNDKLLRSPGTSAPSTSSSATPAQYYSPSTVTPLSTDNTKYYVRVCAVEDAYNFNSQQISSVGGVVEKWPIGTTNKTAIMLTGFPTVGQAMVATDKLRMSGYRDAYIIQDQNGKMSRYSY